MFVGARAGQHGAGATLFGVPYDRTSSFRRGARFAPAEIRWASQSIESYSHVLDRDLEDLAFADAGDLEVEHLSPEDMLEAVSTAVAGIEAFPVLLGGDHTATVGAVRACARRHADLHVLVLDAHLDLRDEYEGSRWSHATTVQRLSEIVPGNRIALLGVRSGTREEYKKAKLLLAAEPALKLPPGLWPQLEGRPLYISIDIDVLDPASAPGTGNPEPGGPAAADLLDLFRIIAPLSVIGIDVVEVSPPFDPSGRTAVLAATIVREAILTFAR